MRADNQLRHRERSLEDDRPPARQIQRENKAYSKDSAGSGHCVDSKSSSLSTFKSISSLQSSSSFESRSSLQSSSRSSQESILQIRAHTDAQRLSTTSTERLDRRYSGTSVLGNRMHTNTINWHITKHEESRSPLHAWMAHNAYPESRQTTAS